MKREPVPIEPVTDKKMGAASCVSSQQHSPLLSENSQDHSPLGRPVSHHHSPLAGAEFLTTIPPLGG